MVNSKRMSKSKVAMIALAILLVLSLILTATGAWYTDNKTDAGKDGATFTLRNSWIQISVTDSTQTLKVYRDENGNGTQTEITKPAAVDHVVPYIVMPGDKIEFSGSAAAFTITGADAYYYVVVYDGKATTSSAIRVDADNALNLETILGQTLTNASGLETDKAGLVADSTNWIVNTALTSASKGAQVASINAVAGYGVYAIQAENRTAATAYSTLKTMFEFDDPAAIGG